MEPLRFVYSDPRMKNLLFQVGMCKTSLMKRLKTHRLLLTRLQITVAGSHLTLPGISVPYVNNSTLPWGISLRGRGTASAANWATGHIFGICWLVPAWTLILEPYFPLRDADLHQCNFLQTWQNPNFAAPAPWHGSHRVFFGVFEGPGSHSLSKCSFRKHTEQWALMWKLLLERWEISHNVVFLTLHSQELSDFKVEECQNFQKGKRKNHWSHPWEEQVSHRQDGVEQSLQILDIFLQTKPTVVSDHNPVTLRNQISQELC